MSRLPTDSGGTRAAAVNARFLLTIFLVGVAYVIFAEIGFSMASATKQVTAVWPPTGIALGALFLLGYRVWPGVFLGALVSNAVSHEPFVTATGIAIGNTLGPMLGVFLLRRFGQFDPAMERVRDVLALLASAAIGMTVTATNGVSNLALAGIVPWSSFSSTWRLWWTGDAMGALLFAPLILTWFTPAPHVRLTWRSALEIAALGAALFAISALAFLSPSTSGYSAYPIVIWAALRFRQRATTLAVVLISAIAIWGAARGLGPYALGSLDIRLSALVTFMALLALSGLLLGAIIAERRQTAAQLQDTERRFHVLAEAVPQMVWMADATGWIDWHNQRWYEYTGQKDGEAAGWGWQRAHHPEDYQRIMTEWPRSIATGEPFEMESRIRCHDGSLRWFLVRAEPLRDADGNVMRWYGTNTDVDDQKRALQNTTRVAETLQAAFLPSRMPRRDDLRFDALYIAAEQDALVGGDWYDALELPDGRILVSIGDVVGHGVGAAVTASRIRQAVFVTAFDTNDPARILAKVNRVLEARESAVATAFVAIIDPELHAIRYANAGHPPPIVASSTTPAYMLPVGGVPLGVDADLQLEVGVASLTTDSIVIFYTDGVTEFKRDIASAEKALLGAAAHLVHDRNNTRPALTVQRAVMGSDPPTDDAVVMVLQRSPSSSHHKVDEPEKRKTWTFHSSDAYFAHAARHELMGFLGRDGAEEDDLARCELIIGELLANTVQHAPGLVRLEVEFHGHHPILTIVDTGPGLRQFSAHLPDDDFTEDGRGLYLIGTLAEAVRVDSTPGLGTRMTVTLPIRRAARLPRDGVFDRGY